MATNFFTRGANTMNSMVLKSMGRKAYHKSSAETIRETMKLEAEEVTNKTHNLSDHATNMSANEANLWVPHGRTGIYYPKGHEKVMEDVPRPNPRNDVVSINFISYNDDL